MSPKRDRRPAPLAVVLVVAAAACSPAPTGTPPASSAPTASLSATASSAATASLSPTQGTAPPSAGASASTDPTAGGWIRTTDIDAVAHGRIESVAWTGARFLAAGWTDAHAIVDSVDGVAWHPQAPFEGDAWTSGPDLVGGRTGVAAAGAGPAVDAIAVGGGNGGPIAVWSSPDGLGWTRVAGQDAFTKRPGFEHVDAVVPWGTGWLAVGGGLYMTTEPPLAGAFVLVSKDGARWQRIEDGEDFDQAFIHAVARTAEGWIAVGARNGTSDSGIPEVRPAVWTSRDGLAWRSAPAPGDDDGGASTRTDVSLEAVAIVAGRAVVAGRVTRLDPDGDRLSPDEAMVWRSEGPTWTATPIGTVGSWPPLRLGPLDGGFLLVGAPTSTCEAGGWASADGLTWRCATLGPAFAGWLVTGSTASDAIELLVGWSRDDQGRAATWTRPAP